MSTKEEIIARHKREQKDLIASITGLKKQATKKTRRNVLNKCNELQRDLELRHKEELKQFETGEEEDLTPEQLLAQLDINKEKSNEKDPADLPSQPNQTEDQPKQKRNRQKERLAKRNAAIERIKAEALKESENAIDYRKIEQDSMNQLLLINNLELYEIKPDGHCLFASIQDQLQLRHNISIGVNELRKRSADYINSHSEDFLPFLFDEVTGELHDLDEYIDKLKNTAMWGSDMEILSLANEFNCPISVYIAGSSTIKINENGEAPELKLGFYKHSFGLGEHYNSLRDIEN